MYDCRKKYIYKRCYKKLNSKQRNSSETYLQKKTMAFLVMRNKSTQTCMVDADRTNVLKHFIQAKLNLHLEDK